MSELVQVIQCADQRYATVFWQKGDDLLFKTICYDEGDVDVCKAKLNSRSKLHSKCDGILISRVGRIGFELFLEPRVGGGT